MRLTINLTLGHGILKSPNHTSNLIPEISLWSSQLVSLK